MRRSIWCVAAVAVAMTGTPVAVRAQPVAGAEFQVGTISYIFARTRIAPGPTGEFVVVWVAGGNDDIFARLFAADGLPQGPDFRVNTYTTSSQVTPGIAKGPGGEFVIVWSSYGQDGDGHGIFGQRYDAAGTPIGGDFAVNTYTTGWQAVPTVGTDAAGNFVVVWSGAGPGDVDGVFARRYDSTGSALGTEVLVNGYTTGAQTGAAVAVAPSGAFVVTWESYLQDGSGSGVFARRFDGTGAPQGAEFQVNTYTTGHQHAPAVAVDPTERFVVAWDSSGEDPVHHPVFARRYDAAGAALGTEFRVSSSSVSTQSTPSVAAEGTTGFIVTWDATLPHHVDSDVFARRFDAAGTPRGPDFRANLFTGLSQGGAVVASDAPGRFIIGWGESDTGRLMARRFGSQAPIGGKKLVLRDGGPSARRLLLLAKDGALSATPGAGLDPVANGGFLQVFNASGSGESACMPLPATGWAATGSGAAPVYTYRDQAFANGPCKVVVLQGGKLRAVCRSDVQPIGYSLDEVNQGSVGVALLSGGARYCALFGGTILSDSGQEGRFVAKDSLAPAVCPTPPAACP